MSFQQQDNLEEESFIVRTEKKVFIMESDDDDIISGSSEEMSDIIPESPSLSVSEIYTTGDNIVTSTPGKVISRSQEKQKDLITDTNDFLPNRSQHESFMVHRSNKGVISSDSEDDSSENIRQSFRKTRLQKSDILLSDIPSEFSNISISDDSDILDASVEDMSSTKSKQHLIRGQTLTQNTTRFLKSGTQTQSTLDNFIKKSSLDDVRVVEDNENGQKLEIPSMSQNDNIQCRRSEYSKQLEAVRQYERDMMKTKNHLSTIKLSALPDNGQLLKDKFDSCKNNFLAAQSRLRRMVVIEEDDHPVQLVGKKVLSQNWTNLEAGIATVQPKTFGKKGLENYNIQKALTAEGLEQIHGSLMNCPTDKQLAEDPKGLKVQLMRHQKRALAWLEYREAQKPPGGILADDMGLGKTLTMISLILKLKLAGRSQEEDSENDESPERKHRKYNGGTLVVCPASLLQQWSGEIDSKVKRGILSYNIYHGPKRETKPKRLAEYDVVITTYSIAMHESDKDGAIFRVRWKRIILDEAHQIRNHKSQTSVACCNLSAKYRWVLTGTPIHNKELDMYGLLKFLRCSPFDDLTVWKRWISDKNSGGGERLHTVISSLMLRRTKDEMIADGSLLNLPSRKWELIPVSLDSSEMVLYQKVLIFSQTLFAQFLHQRAEKNQDIANIRTPNVDPNREYFKTREKLLKLNKLKAVNQHEILVLLLRLRQICCHPSLITNMLQGAEDIGESDTEETDELNLLDQLNELTLLDDESDTNSSGPDVGNKGVGFREAAKGLLNPCHPIFATNRKSSKVLTVLRLIPNILASGDKIVIVSQWTSFLDLICNHLKDVGAKYLKLDGRTPTSKRVEVVSNFNDSNSEFKVLLLSLSAGGVGLNLVGANHLFLLDLHWNPQLEQQAQDRIYRMGQTKNVHIYKFMTIDTIEQRIKKLQEGKLQMSESLMTGTRQVGSKLSLQDLKMLFNV